MEEVLLPRTHPRFCAQYVGFVGYAEQPRTRQYGNLKIEGQPLPFSFRLGNSSDLNPGDVVYLVKLIATHRSQPYRWAVHKIRLAEDYWTYQYWARKTPKERRVWPFKARAQTWFGNGNYLVVPTKP